MTITVVKSQAIIEVLHGSNFKRCNENLHFAFVIAEIDIALCVPNAIIIIVEGIPNQKLSYEKWDKGKSHVSLCD